MNRARLILSAVALVLAVGALTQGARLLSRQREQQLALAQHAGQLEKQLADLHRETTGTQQELFLAEQQLGQLPAPVPSTESAADLARAVEIKTWLARVKRLKESFEQHPEQRIPEMRLLTDEDWLRVAKQSQLDTDESLRKAFAGVRMAAKIRFANQLSPAMRKYVDAAGSAPPTIATALAAYFDPPADIEILQRYDIGRAFQRPGSTTSDWELQERAPVDADYDGRIRVNSGGGTAVTGAPVAWIPNYQERLQQAARAYADANHGVGASSLAPIIPYISPPLDSATVEKLLKAERDRKP